MVKLIEKMKGYKATDKEMKCRGFQFELDKWHEHSGDIELCNSGFHFCVYPSGVYCYYDLGCRVFEIEAELVLETPDEAGADLKKVCKRIRFVKEIFADGNSNTGYGNTGYGNTGNRNTGDSNTGNSNTGDRNTGYGNTGNRNTGYSNTGYSNTGNSNTGYSNTGYSNTGDRNTGYRNTGYSNTGCGNCCDKSSGHFNTKTPKMIMFDKPVKDESEINDSRIWDLSCALLSNEPFKYEDYLDIPNATVAKIKKLHEMHIEKRGKK